MEQIQVLASLVELAERTGIRVRFDRFDPRTRGSQSGGLCVVRGCPTVVLDASASLVDKIAILAEVLARRGVRALYVPRALARPRLRRARSTS